MSGGAAVVERARALTGTPGSDRHPGGRPRPGRDDRFEGSLDPTGFHEGRATWRGAALGSVAGPLKSQVASAACFDVEIERRTATVTFDDAPCSEQVRRTLGGTGNEDDVVSVDLLATVDDATP